MAERALIGAILAAVIAVWARRAGALSASGQWAAVAVGVATAAAGWTWAALLLAYFAAASVLTAFGAAAKAARTQATLPHGHARTAGQVFANGGLFAMLALAAGGRPSSPWSLAALGALAAASADTWATEVGLAIGGQPRSILTGARAAPGLSGGVTAAGLVAAAAGALFVAYAAALFGRAPAGRGVLLVVGVAGFAGAIVDSALGAAIQARRWCDTCGAWTERRVHPCGQPTVHAAGLRWCSNDVVNLATTIVGAAGAAGLARLVP